MINSPKLDTNNVLYTITPSQVVEVRAIPDPPKHQMNERNRRKHQDRRRMRGEKRAVMDRRLPSDRRGPSFDEMV